MSLCLSRKVGGNPGAQFDEIYKKSKEDELAQRCMEEKDCIATGDDSEKDLFTISQSRKVITEQTVQYSVSQSKKKPPGDHNRMQVRSDAIDLLVFDHTLLF